MIFQANHDKMIRIWNFRNGELLKKIKIAAVPYSLCFYGKKKLFIGCKNGCLYLLDLSDEKRKKMTFCHSTSIVSIKRLKFSLKYGFRFFSQGFEKGKIIIWS